MAIARKLRLPSALRRTARWAASLACAFAVSSALTAACDEYEPPPTPTIVGLESAVLYDAKAPLVVDFGMPIDPATISLSVATFETNIEGDLGDEDDDPNTALNVLFGHNPLDGDIAGRIEFANGNRQVVLHPDSAFPVGPKLVLLVEPGLESVDGRRRNNRTRIPFSYAVRCAPSANASRFVNGVYFVLLEVEQPLGTQIQLYGSMNVDPASGTLAATFTNADRNPDNSRCPGGCGAADACRLLPAPECVAPSTKAASVDEYSDFLPNPTPPTGYSFDVEGCVADAENGTGIVTAPAMMVVQSPAVTVAGLVMTAFFGEGADGQPARATGSLTADTVLLGTSAIGAGKGTMTARLMAPSEVPPGVPTAKLPSAAADGGADASTSGSDGGS